MKEVILVLVTLFWVIGSPAFYMDTLHINFWITGIICMTQAVGWLVMFAYLTRYEK